MSAATWRSVHDRARAGVARCGERGGAHGAQACMEGHYGERGSAMQAEQAKLDLAASEHSRVLQSQEKMLQEMLLKLQGLKAVQVSS